jgi:hypothetical protein
MNESRRRFFGRAGLIVAAPTVGVIKAIGAMPKPETLPPFTSGMLLTASELNSRFERLEYMIRHGGLY